MGMSHKLAKRIRKLLIPEVATVGGSRGDLLRSTTKYVTGIPFKDDPFGLNKYQRQVLFLDKDCPRNIIQRVKRSV